MALTCGFYNSETGTHDRRYNAIQMSSIFDGIIKDGIFMSIGDCLTVTSDELDMMVTVGTGRAWFNHTWTLNDAPYLLEIEQSELFHDRIDAVVLEVNSEREVRNNTIKVIKGEANYDPERPELINTETVHQYPLAYISIQAEATIIRQADITSMVGKEPCPYITGILETVDITNMVAQWEDQWKKFYEEYTDDMNNTAKYWKDLWHEWYHMYTDSSTEEWSNWFKEKEASFDTWFKNLQIMLEGDVAVNLANEIETLKNRVDSLKKFEDDLSSEFAIYKPIQDSDRDAIRDNNGQIIDGQIIFALKGEGCCSGMMDDDCNATGCCEIEKDLRHIENKVLNNSASINILRDGIKDIQTDTIETNEMIKKTNNSLNALNVEVREIKANIGSNNGTIGEIEEINHNLAVRIMSLETDVDSLSKHAILDDDYDENDKESSTDSERVSNLENSMKTAQSNISKLRTDMDDLENRAIVMTEDGD